MRDGLVQDAPVAAVNLSSGVSGLLTGGPALFHRRLAIAFLEVRQHDRSHKLLFAVIVELDHDMIVVAGYD